jgi:acetolactate synthase-1/2/3 large subunit
LKQLDLWKESNPFQYDPPPNGALKTQSAIEGVYNAVTKLRAEGDPAVKDELFVATGVGNHQMMACQFFRWTQTRSIITSGSLGTMGFGLPSAIGAQVGKPDATVILIDGDGSFNMTLNDLGTIKELQLPVKICIMNDHRQQVSGYQM